MADALPAATEFGGSFGFLPDEAGRDCSPPPPRRQAYQWDGREDSLQGLRKSRVFRLACCRGEVAVAQWLWNLGKEDDTPGLDIADLREEDCILFFVACAQGDLAMAQWLWEARDVNGEGLTLADVRCRGNRALRGACELGRLELARWIWGLGPLGLAPAEWNSLLIGAYSGEVTEWLLSLPGAPSAVSPVAGHVERTNAFELLGALEPPTRGARATES